MRQVEVQRRDRDVALAQRCLVGIGMRIGATEIWPAPEIDPPARIDAAIELLLIRRHVLRHHADALDRPLVETRNIDVEQASATERMPHDLRYDSSRVLGGLRKIE